MAVAKVEPKAAEPKPTEPKPVVKAVVIEVKLAPAPAEKPAVTVATAKPPSGAAAPPVQPAPAQPAPAAAKPSAPPAATSPERPLPKSGGGGGSHVLSYALGGAGLALLGGGALFSVQAARADNELTAGSHTRADADALIDTSKSKHLLGAVLLGAGILSVAGAAAAFVLSGD